VRPRGLWTLKKEERKKSLTFVGNRTHIPHSPKPAAKSLHRLRVLAKVNH